ncbi:MAG: GDP-mannose 4,6-dehydratase, partial [Pirellulales bacterium]|nr:GDP-mannose 4,6-dehydratase [Pirellulales bacterium]
YGLPTLTTNCSNNYGPFQFPEKLIPLMILNCMNGDPLPLYGDGNQVRDWLYVSDHCRAIRAVLEHGSIGQVYNIGGDSEMNNKEVVHSICSTVDELQPGLPHAPCKSLISYVKDRPGHDRRYAIDFQKIQNEMGWRPTLSFQEGITKTVLWYLEHPEWVAKVVGGGYRNIRLGAP